MVKTNILIVEDELLIAESLKIMLEDLGYHVPAIFTSGTETLKDFKQGLADIVMMDIHLADHINGIDASIGIRKISEIPIIYITDNRDEYLRKKAIYETNAAYFLTKPFTKLDVGIAVDFALKAIKGNDKISELIVDAPDLQNDFIFVKRTEGFIKIMVDDISYLKANGSYCTLIYKENSKDKSLMFTENLSFFENKLKFSKKLIRIHRSYLVNVNYIEKIQENRLWINQTEIPIGNTYKKDLNNTFRFI